MPAVFYFDLLMSLGRHFVAAFTTQARSACTWGPEMRTEVEFGSARAAILHGVSREISGCSAGPCAVAAIRRCSRFAARRRVWGVVCGRFTRR